MKICIPTTDDKEKLAQASDHFGSAQYFTIYDSETETFETVNNSDHDHEHGTCQPMTGIQGKGIDTAVCKGLGKRALLKLNDQGIKVFRTNQLTVKEILNDLTENKLEEMTMENTCRNHGCH